MATSYEEFLARKIAAAPVIGPAVEPTDCHPLLHPWQAELVAWAARVGRAAIWADTGLGKTLMQIEWARLVAKGGRALVVAPLAVCHQTVREAAKIGVSAQYVRDGNLPEPGTLAVTNYEMVQHVDSAMLDAVVLDLDDNAAAS